MAYFEKYFFTWIADRDTRISGGTPDNYECVIQQLDYTGAAEELQAQANPVQITYQNTGDNVMQAIRGSEVTLNLIATVSFQLEDLYTENEREFLVLIYRNSSVIWRGFIIPDGCQEQFMFEPYAVSINAVDTLGLLKNLSYVQNDGNFWLGKQSFLEIIYNCLNRIEIPDMDLYTCVNIYETAQTQGDTYDPLALTFTNAERYLKDDGINPLNCEEVLNAVLQEWTATIIQSEGNFYVFRPNELALSALLTFRKYTGGLPPYSGYYIQKNLAQILGGESEGTVIAPLFHIHSDQLKMIVKPYKNASMSYKFGALGSILENPTFDGWTGFAFPDWAKSHTTLPLSEDAVVGGAKIGKLPVVAPLAYLYSITGGIGTIGDILIVTVPYYNYRSDGPLIEVVLTDGVTPYYVNAFGAWSTTQTYVDVPAGLYQEGEIYIKTSVLPISGTVTIRLYEARNNIVGAGVDLFITYIRANISTAIGETDPIGEIHTAAQTGVFTHVPDTINVFNGDSTIKQYTGAMYLANLTTLTTAWNRRGLSESVLALPYEASKNFLRIAVEEIQRMHALPYVRFEGTIFGYFNPISRFTINLLTGHFMPLSLTYDLQDNTCKAVLARVSNDEIALNYTLEPDYGETTKVTINQGP